jgi:sporulation protein YlmC with PRC-barrel domain
MSERFTAVPGRMVVSRASAEELGNLARIVVDAERRRVALLVVGKGRKAMVIDWDRVSGFGPDAVMVADESALHPPSGEREHAAASGKLELAGKRVLSDMGNDLGTVTDVVFDPGTGTLETLVLGDRETPIASLLAVGSFAVIVREPAE